MATSGSVDFSLNRNEIIQDAAEEIGIAIDGEALDAAVISVAKRVLNRMVKAWVAYGLNLWKRDTKSITLVASTNTYTLGPTGTVASSARPLRIINCERKDTDNITTPMTFMELSEYEDLSNKETTGTPVNFYYSPDLPDGTLKVWPTPDAAAAAEYTVEIIYHAPFEDFDASTDDPDFPQEWLEALVYGLALRLAPKYGSLTPYEMNNLRKMAEDSLNLALSWDVEDGSVWLHPDMDNK